MSRRLARKHVFFVIFQLEFHNDLNVIEIHDSIMEFDKGSKYEQNFDTIDKEFVFSEINGIFDNLEFIDSKIGEYSVKWDFQRLNKIDLALLRLSLYEIFFREDIPQSVSVNEVVELSKVYGTDESSSFINGILGNIIKEREINA